MPVFAVSSCIFIILYVGISPLPIQEFMGTLIYWFGTFLYFSFIDKTFRKKPLKLFVLTVLFITCQIPIFALLEKFHMFNLFDMVLITLVPIEIVYLPDCIWRYIVTLWLWTNNKIKDSTKKGDLIILKINLFYEMHGRYPYQLTELVPEYIDTLPLPSAGAKQWNYSAERGDEFSLGFSMPRDSKWYGYPISQYDSRSGKWLIDQ